MRCAASPVAAASLYTGQSQKRLLAGYSSTALSYCWPAPLLLLPSQAISMVRPSALGCSAALFPMRSSSTPSSYCRQYSQEPARQQSEQTMRLKGRISTAQAAQHYSCTSSPWPGWLPCRCCRACAGHGLGRSCRGQAGGWMRRRCVGSSPGQCYVCGWHQRLRACMCA